MTPLHVEISVDSPNCYYGANDLLFQKRGIYEGHYSRRRFGHSSVSAITVTSKQLLPVYDKPMIYYPMSVLMMAGIRDILLSPRRTTCPTFERLLGDGSQFWHCCLTPNSLRLMVLLRRSLSARSLLPANLVRLCLATTSSMAMAWAVIFALPLRPLSRATAQPYLAITSTTPSASAWSSSIKTTMPSLSKRSLSTRSLPMPLLVCISTIRACELAKKVKPAARGELEITDLNRMYLEDGTLSVVTLGRGYAWLDTGTMESLRGLASSRAVERSQDLPVRS